MKKKGKLTHMTLMEFADWLDGSRFDRQIGVIQNHHTYTGPCPFQGQQPHRPV